jgi:hypothetical protein
MVQNFKKIVYKKMDQTGQGQALPGPWYKAGLGRIQEPTMSHDLSNKLYGLLGTGVIKEHKLI